MMMISLVVVMDEDRGIGKENKLLCHLPADLKHFKAITMGKPIIMGRKTFDSIGRALPGRLNIVLSRQALLIEGVTVVASLDQALALTQDEPEVMIIGGANLFKQALPLANQIYLTVIHHRFVADVFFPDLLEDEWSVQESMLRLHDDKNAYDMTFYRYSSL